MSEHSEPLPPEQAFQELVALSEDLELYDQSHLFTKTGKALTGADIEQLAAEAEQGYDIAAIAPENVTGTLHHVHDSENVSGDDTPPLT